MVNENNSGMMRIALGQIHEQRWNRVEIVGDEYTLFDKRTG
jgi:hypothetical protein